MKVSMLIITLTYHWEPSNASKWSFHSSNWSLWDDKIKISIWDIHWRQTNTYKFNVTGRILKCIEYCLKY